MNFALFNFRSGPLYIYLYCASLIINPQVKCYPCTSRFSGTGQATFVKNSENKKFSLVVGEFFDEYI